MVEQRRELTRVTDNTWSMISGCPRLAPLRNRSCRRCPAAASDFASSDSESSFP